MSRLKTRHELDLQADTLAALAPVRVKDKIADVYLQFANSEQALRAYLTMEVSIREGSLALREVEAIKLWMSQQMNCEYCLSVHSYKARQAGLETEEQLALRQGIPFGDARLECLLQLAEALLHRPGTLDDSLLAKAREHGFTDQNLVDLTMAMSTIFFTNITNHINDSLSSLPRAPSLP